MLKNIKIQQVLNLEKPKKSDILKGLDINFELKAYLCAIFEI
jgi:hypothetical protein